MINYVLKHDRMTCLCIPGWYGWCYTNTSSSSQN